MHAVKQSMSIRRIAATSLSLLAMAVAGTWASVRASTSPPVSSEGPMSDRVLESLNDGVPAPVVRRRARIREVLQSTPAAEWAGEYYGGDGLGVNVTLSLAPGAGIAATWFGCLGLYASNEGDVEERADGTLAFHFNRPNTRGSWNPTENFPSRVRLVRWGERRYLLADKEMIAFVNAMHHGWEPAAERQGLFLMAEGDEERPAPGLPGLPREVLDYVRSTALEVQPISIEDVMDSDGGTGPRCRFRVHFDVPAGERLAEGIEFQVKFPAGIYQEFRVVGIAGVHVSADAQYQRNCRDSEKRPTSDWVLTSGAFRPGGSGVATVDMAAWGSAAASDGRER